MGGLPLQPPQRSKFTLGLDDPLDRIDAECSYQLVLEILLTDEETEQFQVPTIQNRAVTRQFQLAAKVALLPGVAQPGHALTASETTEMEADVGRSAHGHHRGALRGQVTPPTPRQGLQSCLVTGTLDQDDRCRC